MELEWNGAISRKQAIKFIDRITDLEDPFWSYAVEDFYHEETDTMPSIYHFMDALGVTEEEYKEATGAENVAWPKPSPPTGEEK